MYFIAGIGLHVEIVPGACGFIEGVRVVAGGLHVDQGARASGLLHEAGHLAIVPNAYRHYLNGDLDEGIGQIFDEVDALGLEHDEPLLRAMLQAGDSEATAWAWAAGKALCLPEEKIIQNDEYGGDGAFIRSALAANSYVGINGISHAGFCVMRANPYRNLPVYPGMAFWLQGAAARGEELRL